jgi:hypothetical protein
MTRTDHLAMTGARLRAAVPARVEGDGAVVPPGPVFRNDA